MLNLKRVGIREFQRNLYNYIGSIPLMVTNYRSKKDLFMVLPPETFEYLAKKMGGEKNG
jgi:hypothetical protein